MKPRARYISMAACAMAVWVFLTPPSAAGNDLLICGNEWVSFQEPGGLRITMRKSNILYVRSMMETAFAYYANRRSEDGVGYYKLQGPAVDGLIVCLMGKEALRKAQVAQATQ